MLLLFLNCIYFETKSQTIFPRETGTEQDSLEMARNWMSESRTLNKRSEAWEVNSYKSDIVAYKPLPSLLDTWHFIASILVSFITDIWYFYNITHKISKSIKICISWFLINKILYYHFETHIHIISKQFYKVESLECVPTWLIVVYVYFTYVVFQISLSVYKILSKSVQSILTRRSNKHANTHTHIHPHINFRIHNSVLYQLNNLKIHLKRHILAHSLNHNITHLL